jgi:hypothetical protein
MGACICDKYIHVYIFDTKQNDNDSYFMSGLFGEKHFIGVAKTH